MEMLTYGPSLQMITTVLQLAACVSDPIMGTAEAVDRRPNIFSSTALSEIVECRLRNDTRLELLCKYGRDQNVITHAHRGGTPYEAIVYREVLRPLQVTSAKYYGTYEDTATGFTGLFIEYLDKAKRVGRAHPSAMEAAARWLGEFHAVAELWLLENPKPFIKRYNANYYSGWAGRSASLSGDLQERHPWLLEVCRKSETAFGPLLSSPVTIIHGEYYSHNVLWRNGVVYPVDWESTAVACGEIDLASLTDRWPERVAQRCRRAYKRARWPQGAPVAFEQRLAVAELYWPLRWLGDPPEWNSVEEREVLCHLLRSAAERLRLI